jgi:hypothetical protein
MPRLMSLPAIVAIILASAATAAVAQQPGNFAERPASFERSEFRTVSFGRQLPQVGDQTEQTLSMELRLDTTIRQGNQLVERGATAMCREQHRVITTSEVADDRTTAARVRYVAATTKTGRGERLRDLDGQNLGTAAQPVEGKAYDCRLDDDKLVVTDPQGDIPPIEEYQIVAENMQSLGQSNPLAEFLVGRTIGVGQQLTLPREVAERLLGIGDSLGRVNQFVLTLEDVRHIDGVQCAVFKAGVDAASNDSSQMRLELAGPLVIQVDTCRAVQADLVGPIGMTETRGSLDHTYQMAGTGRMTVRIVSTYHDVAR